jgi:hypothetical protein
MEPADRAWVAQAATAWGVTARGLPADGAPLPTTYVFFDARCVYEGAAPRMLRGRAHGGEVDFPDGNTAEPQVASFAAPYDGGRRVYMTMALPSVWAAGGVTSELTLETLMTAVFVHEMTHTRQFAAFNPRLDAMTTRWRLPEDINDDALQERFAEVPEYVAAIETERTLLFEAAAAPDDATARALARQALEAISARRARTAVGADAKYAEIEDVFLSLEGAAQWAAFRWLTDPEGAGYAREVAMPLFRRGGRQWSQDEGLAVYLVIDRLYPEWIARTFADAEPATALELLTAAVEGH